MFTTKTFFDGRLPHYRIIAIGMGTTRADLAARSNEKSIWAQVYGKRIFRELYCKHRAGRSESGFERRGGPGRGGTTVWRNAMKVEFVEMAGFRGFREKTRIVLPPGFAVLNGHNGTGKSTVLDAIDYALTGTINKFSVKARKAGD
jgi:hypothetical protein